MKGLIRRLPDWALVLLHDELSRLGGVFFIGTLVAIRFELAERHWDDEQPRSRSHRVNGRGSDAVS